ncbi:30S ribosome-binding factor RbfA [Pendulispora rubella]|uniref:Ribosome-binding factor A n=1 Tax=Pendulispora rubella TaxID=2741070 RepID=A0ABZ2L184_9BACT
MAAEVKRATRVAEGIREELANLLARKVRDPRVAGVVVSRVTVTDDLRNAKVYVRLLDLVERDEARQKELMIGLKSAAGMLRSSITKELSLRVAPELRFYYDEAVEKQQKVDELLAEIERDARSK